MRPELILIAEKEDEVRTMVGQILTQKGYRVLEARDGPDALRLASRHGEEIDLLLTDVQLSLQIRQVRDDLRVLYMSGYSDAPLGPEAALLRKPFTVRELLRSVRAALAAPLKKPVQIQRGGAGGAASSAG